MKKLSLQQLFFLILFRPLIKIFLGRNIHHSDLLPQRGPAIVVANHNSHLDAMVLMTLFPQSQLPSVRPVAASDYFLKSKFLKWFSLKILHIIPISRHVVHSDTHPLQGVVDALQNAEILIWFPEGTRGEPEILSEFKNGIAHVANLFPQVKITPIFMYGLGKSLPKGASIPLPLNIEIFIGEPLNWHDNREIFMHDLKDSINALATQGNFPPWL